MAAAVCGNWWCRNCETVTRMVYLVQPSSESAIARQQQQSPTAAMNDDVELDFNESKEEGSSSALLQTNQGTSSRSAVSDSLNSEADDDFHYTSEDDHAPLT